MTEKRPRILVVHPFFFALYPLLFLYARNMDEVPFVDLLKPAGVVLLAASLLLFLLKKALRDTRSAGVITSFTITTFFSYGRFDKYLQVLLGHGHMKPFAISLHLTILGVLWLIGVLLLLKARGTVRVMTLFLNVAGCSLVLMSLFSITRYVACGDRTDEAAGRWNEKVIQPWAKVRLKRLETSERLPDIYYIILDEYARADTLKNLYGLDNGEFVGYLQKKGFYVASHSRSNYLHTGFSLPSSLSFDYVQTLMKEADISSVTARFYKGMIEDCRIVRLLKQNGYTFVFLPSSYYVTCRNRCADLLISSGKMPLTDFDRMLLQTSVLRIFSAGLNSYRMTLLSNIDQLRHIPELKEPTFTLAHITLPHPPFVFDANGNIPRISQDYSEDMEERIYVTSYREQVQYTNKLVRQLVQSILSKSDTPPIIILQGDHGPRYYALLKRKTPIRTPDGKAVTFDLVASRIFNAYYLPQGGNKSLYESISPVNSFRVVLNHYFGANLPLLKDVTYRAEWRNDRIYVTDFKPLPD